MTPEAEYRVVEINGYYSPQMKFLVRDKWRWFSLLRNGYWADPDGWNVDTSDGEDVIVLMQTMEMADSAIDKAKKINQQ